MRGPRYVIGCRQPCLWFVGYRLAWRSAANDERFWPHVPNDVALMRRPTQPSTRGGRDALRR
jgi:hypothetical protein